MADEGPNVCTLLREFSEGKPAALDRLVPVVYDELRRMAHGQLRGERSRHTLTTAALVHETYLRLVQIEHIDWWGSA
jgi:hypothetical protein